MVEIEIPLEPITNKEPFHTYREFFKKEEKEQADFYRECIELAYSVTNDARKIKKEKFKTVKEPESHHLLTDFYEGNILHSFIAHYCLLEKGLLLASFSNIRTIYENLLRIYLIKTNKKSADLIYKYETRENKKYSEEEKEQIEKDFKKEKHLRMSYIINKIYSGKKKENVYKHYGELSEMVHPEVRGRHFMFQEADKPTLTNAIKRGTLLTIANFVLICENYKRDLIKENKGKIREVVKKVVKKYCEYPDFYPDINSDKLHFGTHQKFLDYLRCNSD